MVANAKGLSSLTILIMAIVGIIAFWEANQYVKVYLYGDESLINNSNSQTSKADCPSKLFNPDGSCDDDTDEGAPKVGAPPICKTGNPQDCNDSGDVFKFNK